MRKQLLELQQLNSLMIEIMTGMKEEMESLRLLVETTFTEIKELQDQTGITFDRWKSERKEEITLYIRNRIEHHRSNGEGSMAANRMAFEDLKAQHQRILRQS